MGITIMESDRTALLRTALEAIAVRLEGRPARWPAVSQIGDEPLGAFVTLHKRSPHGRRLLRGCIGRIRSEEPLRLTVRAMAEAAAFEDPRFPSLCRSELPSVDIEISVLSPFEPCAPDGVEPGLHGVYLVKSGRSAVFLPQVAPEQGWDREELLRQLCRKGGLPDEAYAEPDARLFRFTATVFGEVKG